MYDDESSVPPAPNAPLAAAPELPPAPPVTTWAPAVPFNVLPPAAPASRRPAWLPLAGAVTAVIALAAVALVVLGGPSGSKADAATIVRAASQRAASAGSSDVAIDMKMEVAGHTVHATGAGAFDYRRGLGYMSLDMGGIGEMQEVITRKALYIRLPDALRGALGANRPWMAMHFATLKRATGVDMAKLMNANPTGDPTSMLRVLAKANVVTTDGSEDVRGVSTTHYSVTATMQQLLQAEGLTSAVDLTKQAPGAADTVLHLGVYVDKAGMPRRVSMSSDVAGMGSLTMNMDMFDFGAPVHVSVPPSSIVMDISKELAG